MASSLCSPCDLDWGVAPDDLTCDGVDLANVSSKLKTEAVEAATRLLYDKTCQRFRGECTAVLRPFLSGYDCAQPPRWPHTVDDGRSRWYMAMDLGVEPVTELVAVTINGVDEDLTADPPDWRIDEGRWLVRQDRALTWPDQDMNAPLGESGTWSVTVRWGAPPPGLAKLAVSSLACQFVKARTGADCDLPDAVTSVTKRGVTLNFATMAEMLETGMTGDSLADQLIATYQCQPGDGYAFSDPADPVVIGAGDGSG